MNEKEQKKSKNASEYCSIRFEATAQLRLFISASIRVSGGSQRSRGHLQRRQIDQAVSTNEQKHVNKSFISPLGWAC